MGNKVYIIWESSGSYDDSYTGIHKIYSNETSANKECDRLNAELNIKKDKYINMGDKMEEHYTHCGLDECEFCDEYNDLQYAYYEQHPYRVTCKEVYND